MEHAARIVYIFIQLNPDLGFVSQNLVNVEVYLFWGVEEDQIILSEDAFWEKIDLFYVFSYSY